MVAFIIFMFRFKFLKLFYYYFTVVLNWFAFFRLSMFLFMNWTWSPLFFSLFIIFFPKYYQPKCSSPNYVRWVVIDQRQLIGVGHGLGLIRFYGTGLQVFHPLFFFSSKIWNEVRPSAVMAIEVMGLHKNGGTCLFQFGGEGPSL